jgi:hypothetical protein
MFEHINHLISRRGYAYASWKDRYSKGIWAICTPLPEQAAEVNAASSDGDFPMAAAADFLLDNDWLPVAVGDSLSSALQALEDRLAARAGEVLREGSDWSIAVWDVFTHFQEARRSGGQHGDFSDLPATLPVSQPHSFTEVDLTWVPATELLEGDLLAEAGRHDEAILLRKVLEVEFADDGEIVVRHGPVGLALTCYGRDDNVQVVARAP